MTSLLRAYRARLHSAGRPLLLSRSCGRDSSRRGLRRILENGAPRKRSQVKGVAPKNWRRRYVAMRLKVWMQRRLSG